MLRRLSCRCLVLAGIGWGCTNYALEISLGQEADQAEKNLLEFTWTRDFAGPKADFPSDLIWEPAWLHSIALPNFQALGSDQNPAPLATAQPPVVAEAARRPVFEALLDTRFLFLSGFVSAREFAVEGDRFTFKRLNADFGENAGLQVIWNGSSSDRLEFRAAYFFLNGRTTLESDRVFNATTIQGGTVLETDPHWYELRLTYLRRLFELSSFRSSFWFLFGIDYHHVKWKFKASVSPASTGHEPAEDFDRQTFPLPVFGLRYLLDLGPNWYFDLRADAFRANHWRHWNDEGGPIYTSSTIVDVLGMLRWQPTSLFFMEAGYTFNYFTIDEDGPEDGNHLLAREHGPVIGIGLSW